ncbi:helix-turn-helix domain-containing protein [Kitasatospora sp. NPDC088134]|uniref:helix-turn-helix domain-containing protein n=1 Tax=Kitasatospora sp. NPDC088134 TaxID=3364071 RepID=UPI0037F6DAAC
MKQEYSPLTVARSARLVRLLRSHLRNLVASATGRRQEALPLLADATVALLAGMLVQLAGGRYRSESGSRRGLLLVRTGAFIDAHLGDPGLTPPGVAAAHHIPLRYLHPLFEGSGTTVADKMRAERLERVRRDLADPLHDGQPVHAIAARWGTRDPSSFSRAFRAAHGTAPGGYRQACREHRLLHRAPEACVPGGPAWIGAVRWWAGGVVRRYDAWRATQVPGWPTSQL